MDTIAKPPMYEDLERPCLGEAELFFSPEPPHNRSWNPVHAQALCLKCEHKTECLEVALNPSKPMHYGVWGGKNEEERRAIARCRRGECGTTCSHIYRERSTG